MALAALFGWFFSKFSIWGMLTDTLRGKIRERVKIFAGDVVLLRLGLSEEDYTFLSHDVDTVIHAAAYVNLIYPYEVRSNTVFKVCH